MAQSFFPLQLAQNRILVNVDAADQVAYPVRSGLRYYLTLMVPAFYLSNQFMQLVEFDGSEVPPETVAGGTIFRGAYFELQDQLDSLLKRRAPTFGQSGISVCDGLTIPYYASVRVENNDVVVSQQDLPVQYAIKAGISEADFRDYRSSFFTDFVGANGRFLTWTPDEKPVRPDQPEFLYWLSNGSPTPAQLNLRVQVMNTESQATPDIYTATTLTSVTPMTVYCLAVGPAVLGVTNRPGTAAQYAVWLEDQNGLRLTSVRTYRLDPVYRPNVKYLVFANSLGGFDTLCLTGMTDEAMKVVRDTSERYPAYSFDPQYAETVVNQVTGERQLTINTGFLTPSGRTYLQELLLSKEVYVVTDRALIPLVPTTETLVTDSDAEEGVISRTLTFRYANPTANFSRLPAASAGTSARLTGWRPKNYACLLDANGKRTGKKAVAMLEKYYLDTGARLVDVPLKPNTPGTDGYIVPDFSADCQVTPYLSAAISRTTTYSRTTCSDGQSGGPATVVIAAGSFGSELSQADADAKAEAEFKRLNTQEFANQNGTCNAVPEAYDVAVPGGYWHYRTNNPAKTDITFRDGNTYPLYGNSYMVQGNGNANSYAYGTNDLNFPTGGYTFCNVRIYGSAGAAKRFRVYVNAGLIKDLTLNLNSDGYENLGVLPDGAYFSSGDKVFIRVDDL